MRFFRGLVALIFAGILVLGLVKWYQTDYSSRDKDLFSPVWNKLATLVTPKQKEAKVKTKQKNNTLHPDVTTGELPIKSYNTLVAGSRVLGNAKAKLAMVIFCDYAVGYCKELHDSGAIYDYQKILDNELSIIWKPFPKSPRSSTLSSHKAYLCAEKTANDDQLLEFQQYLFKQDSYSDNALMNAAESFAIPGFTQCFTRKSSTTVPSITTQIQQQREQAKTMIGLTALPTILIYNTQSQDYYKIPGRYPLEEIAETFAYIRDAEVQ